MYFDLFPVHYLNFILASENGPATLSGKVLTVRALNGNLRLTQARTCHTANTFLQLGVRQTIRTGTTILADAHLEGRRCQRLRLF